MADRVEIGRRNKTRSKVYEREWGAAFGTTRVTDNRGVSQADLFVGDMDVEIKSRKGFKGLVKLMEETHKKARTGQFAVLGLELRDTHPNTRLVVMERQDFLDLLNTRYFHQRVRDRFGLDKDST